MVGGWFIGGLCIKKERRMRLGRNYNRRCVSQVLFILFLVLLVSADPDNPNPDPRYTYNPTSLASSSFLQSFPFTTPQKSDNTRAE